MTDLIKNASHGEPFDVYIGRGSPYGNPFSHKPSQFSVVAVASRDEAVERYRAWVLGGEAISGWTPPTREQILALHGKRLGCWCAPERCHGEVLIELTERWPDDAADAEDPVLESEAEPAVDAPGPGPFLRWAGSKRWVAKQLATHILFHLAPGARYVEPFLGSGAVALALPEGTPMLLSDACVPLMGLWWWIKRDPVALAAAIPPAQWNVEDVYYRVRGEFNQQPFSSKTPEPSAKLLWLNHTCYNGIYRENDSGAYNVPWGKRKTIRLPTVEQLVATSQRLRRASVLLGMDFERALVQVRRGDVVYADPPYDGTFTDYNAGGFGPDDQARLARALVTCANRGATVITTNSDTPRIRELYQGWQVEPLEEPRSIGGKGASRASAACLILTLSGEANVR